jgi:hypothetical protein
MTTKKELMAMKKDILAIGVWKILCQTKERTKREKSCNR